MSDDELLARLALTDRNCACPGCKVRRDAAARIRAQAARIAVLEGLLRECIAAASADKVEDFSAVSNAADRAAELLRAGRKGAENMKLPDEVVKALYDIGLTYPPQRAIEAIVRHCAMIAATELDRSGNEECSEYVAQAILAEFGLGE